MKVLIHEWVTGGGLAGEPLPASWAAEGHAMRRAIAADFRSLDGVVVVTTLDRRFSDDRPGADATLVGPGEENAVLTRLAGSCDYTIVIAPETGGVLHDRTGLIDRAGGTSLGSLQGAIALAGDKWLLARHLVAAGVRTARTDRIDPRSPLPRNYPYPAVIKPVDGAGSLHTYYREGPDGPPFAADAPGEMLIQPHCPGRPLSATFLVGPSGAVKLVGVGWQRVDVRGGVMTYGGGRLPAPAGFALDGPLAAVRSLKGLRGVVGVDFVRNEADGATTVIEINPRPTTSYVGLARLLPPGSIARSWLALFSGQDAADNLRGMIPPGAGACLDFLPDGTTSTGAGGFDDGR